MYALQAFHFVFISLIHNELSYLNMFEMYGYKDCFEHTCRYDSGQTHNSPNTYACHNIGYLYCTDCCNICIYILQQSVQSVMEISVIRPT